MKLILTFLLLFSTLISSAQSDEEDKYLEQDKEKHHYLTTNGRVSLDSTFEISNLQTDTLERDSTLSLEDKGHRVLANAEISNIEISLNSIGRIVLYAALVDYPEADGLADSRIEIVSYKNNQVYKKYLPKKKYNGTFYEDIYIGYEKAGINKVTIEFQSETTKRFVIGKLKVIPLSKIGIDTLTKRENREIQIKDLSQNIDEAAKLIKVNYLDQIKHIDLLYYNLTKVIDGNDIENLSAKKASSLNVMIDKEFISVYEESIKSNVSANSQSKLENIKNSLNLKQMVTSADQLITGGRFSALINFMDGLYDKEFVHKDYELPLVNINGEMFSQQVNVRNKTRKLTPIVSTVIKKEYADAVSTNVDFKKCITQLIAYQQEDFEQSEKLTAYVFELKGIRKELEQFTINTFGEYIKDTSQIFVNYKMDDALLKDDVRLNFNVDTMSSLNKLTARNNADKAIDQLNALSKKYLSAMTKIKDQYDLIYENTPMERRESFNELKPLSSLALKWYKNQTEIKDTYNAGLKKKLKVALGNENLK
ncbi:MAG: hypothetical protein HKP14_05070 [Bacteroidia bacterium]|nr:hypothetical protein [Bacteroidia bacterium]